MSFITKRERVFNEYDLFDLPARNEGKLKAYSSCTDARAWSHFCSDKTEHLVEIIKRNNETHRPKYIPTDVIVNTLMTSKNAEIARLKRKIGEFEQMLAAYDDLDLTCEQKCDIANAHAAIKAANKELDEMCLDLDLSGFTEGIDSEAFETGKSRGDEPSRYTAELLMLMLMLSLQTGKSRGYEWTMGKVSTPRMDTKGNQIEISKMDESTSAHDNRIDELQETIICKDAKLNAMQNTIAVLENDVCEPYCIYAHIYTALEKIFGTLCQNDKYKQYLDLLTNGKDIRGINIQGKIIFKIKVLEKFSLALIAPCAQDSSSVKKDCSCYRAEIVTRVETAFALTSAESKIPSLDTKRAHLVADIMQNEDMKEILSKDSLTQKIEDDQLDECFVVEDDGINAKNLKRLKNLQLNYDELLNCYDNLKHERDSLVVRCQKFFELESECECLQNKLREYNELWKDREYYRKRSEDLDALKENYYVLSEETASIETKLKAEKEINKNKSATIDELRNENIKLENKISEICLSYEKQRNVLICKLKECECKMMCQDQQIKSLTNQIDNILNGDSNNILQNEDDTQSMELMDEIKSQKEQIINLKDALCCSEEEKQYFQEEFEKKLDVINELKLEIEAWKSKYENTNQYLENYLEKYQMQINELQDSNNSAVENLNHIINSKSQEITFLTDELDRKNVENENLVKQVKSIYDDFENKVTLLESEKKIAISSIHSAKKESLEILQNVKNYENTNIEESNESIEINYQTNNDSPKRLIDQSLNSDNVYFLKEIQLLREINLESVHFLQNENEQLKRSFEEVNHETEKLKNALLKQEDYVQKFNQLKESHENLLNEKARLQDDLNNKTFELDNVLHAFQLTKKESESLLDQLNKSEYFQEEYVKLNEAYQKLITERNLLQSKMSQIEKELEGSLNAYKNMREENEVLQLNLKDKINIEESFSNLKENYKKLKDTNNDLQRDFNDKTAEIIDLYNTLENKNKENEHLNEKIKNLEVQDRQASSSINSLKTKNSNMKLKLNTLTNEYGYLERNFKELTESHEKLKIEREILEKELQKQLEILNKLQQENLSLNNETKSLLIHNENLEKALIQARVEDSTKSESLHVCYQDIKKEIDSLRDEKISYHKKITDLLDKLEESEFLTSDLSEQIINKDKKIYTLENHINDLEVEIRKLQYNLNEVIESGEQIRQLSYERINQSFKTIEAHHSKATHNMKMELAKQQNENRSQLNSSKLTMDDSLEDENKILIQIKELGEERLEIISKIRELELRYLGDTNLSKINSTVKDIIVSLDRINEYISEKNSSFEKTLSNVQASYQLLKSKAHEAKIIAEKERQNIINEKEEIHRGRKKLEEHLENLKNEKIEYEKVINDLEGEIMNHKEENISLQDQYNNSLNVIRGLQEKLDTEIKDKNTCLEHTEKAKSVIEEKSNEISKLKKYFEEIKNKPTTNFTTQTDVLSVSKDDYSQTETQASLNEYKNESNYNILTASIKNASDLLKFNKEKGNLNLTDFFKTEDGKLTVDSVKYIYMNYKIKNLSLGRLEQYSITDLHNYEILNDNERKILDNVVYVKSPVFNNLNSSVNNNSVIDICSTQILTSTTKNTCDNDNFTSKDQTESLKSCSIDKKHKNFENDFDSFKENIVFDDSPISTDKDMFLIYKESESIFDDQGNNDNKPWSQNGLTNMIVERAIIHTNEDQLQTRYKIIKDIKKQSADGEKEDDSVKMKLKIKLPRVFRDLSTTTVSDADTKSLDSYNRARNASSRWVIYSDTKINSNSSKNADESNLTSTILNVSDDQVIDQHKKISKHNVHLKKDLQKSQTKSIKKTQYRPNDVDTTETQNEEIQSTVQSIYNSNSNPNLSRINANTSVIKDIVRNDTNEPKLYENNDGLNYVLEFVKNNIGFNNNLNLDNVIPLRKSYSGKNVFVKSGSSQSEKSSLLKTTPDESISAKSNIKPTNKVTDRGILVKLDVAEVDYQNKIQQLTDTLKVLEKHYNKKLDAVKAQYENNIKHIISEHNQGVENIQYLHEEAVHEIINKHGNEIENLRTMSIEAMRKAEKLGNENRCLKSKLNNNLILDEIPVKILTPELKKKKGRSRTENTTLTKTIVDAFNVKPKNRSHGPCTCSLDINISDTIRNIFEQVDADQRKMAEMAYLKYIANKILNDTVEVLDAQELSFLHLKVCRTWKARLSKEETLQKRNGSLKSEYMNKRRQTQKNMADLDRKVAEEWRRLQEVREAVCRSTPNPTRDNSPETTNKTPAIAEKDVCNCNSVSKIAVDERRSAGDLELKQTCTRPKRGKLETHRAVLAKLDIEQRREKKLYNDETPTRLKRSQDRQNTRTAKK
ncbi:putative leucine-rich repeat-containing protein DDB_G0290503 [Vanessa atalanta]|uniref:putative leucine-rich repeat-containing protein DDB_G0290503 n=1 Tax=Vanessa atalanta TaxID=42275 RepID=UPI001FCCC643|nr:putative leucine-rich repeat-containing protein DDB_G0290503 [Vanessa atalanta]